MVLGDFGLARAGLRGGSKAVGTKEFMAPEMVNPGCEGYDTAAADVWAAGVVGIMCLTHIGVGWHRGEVVFPSAPQLKGLSESGWSFFRSLFKYDPVYRPTAGTLLTHPWFAEEEEREKMKGEDALPRIKADGFAPVLIADDGAITP